MQKKTGYTLLTALLLIVAVNVVSRLYPVRLDLTEDRAYTLNPVTRQVLRSLKEPVTITAYFTKDLPPDLTKTKEDFRALMAEYEAIAGRNLVFDIIDPADDKTLEEKAYKAKIQPQVLMVREKDQSIQRVVYLGIVVQYLEHEIALPLIQPGISLEYYITMAIQEMSDPAKPRIALLQGHGELRPEEMFQASEMLNALYRMDTVRLCDSILSRDRYAAMAILHPRRPFSDGELEMLDRYLASGGNLFVSLQTVTFDYGQAEAVRLDTRLDRWLHAKGVDIAPQLVIDTECGVIGVMQEGTDQTAKVPFPFYPVIKRFEEHPITYGMTSLVMQEASPITFNDSVQAVFTPLMRTSRQTGLVGLPYHIMIDRNWNSTDFPQGGLVTAATVEGRLAGTASNRMVVVANGSFPVGAKDVNIIADNANLLPNAIDWLTDDTGFIALRSKHTVSRNIQQLSDSTRMWLKWGNFLLPMLGIAAAGLLLMHRSRRRRQRRMQPDYTD